VLDALDGGALVRHWMEVRFAPLVALSDTNDDGCCCVVLHFFSSSRLLRKKAPVFLPEIACFPQ